MSEIDRLGTQSTRITSDEIVQRAFPSKVRGISETEVRSFLRRIADDVEQMQAREAQLVEQIRQLEHNVENRPKVTKQELLESLGEETARVLSSAEEAAENMLNEAKDAAEKTLKNAKEKADEITTTAQSAADTKMDNTHSRIRKLHESAQRDVETLVEEARTMGREIFQDAVIVREKILKDLLRRRDLLLEQIDELRKGREELLESYKIVKGSFQKATDSLHAVEEKASTELMSQQIDVDELLKTPVELPQTLEVGHKTPSQEIDLTKEEMKSDEAIASSNASIKIEDKEIVLEENVEEKVLVSATTAPATSSSSVISNTEKKKGIRGYMKDALGVSEEPKASIINPDDVKVATDQESIAIKIVDTPKSESEPQKPEAKTEENISEIKEEVKLVQIKKEEKEVEAKDAIKVEDKPASIEQEVKETGKENEAAPQPAPQKDVGALFKSLKEQKAPTEKVETSETNKKEDPKAVAEPQVKAEATDSSKKEENKKVEAKAKKNKTKTSPIEIRDEVFDSITSSILRKAKRQLQDEQNELLENLRTVKSKKAIDVQSVLPDEVTQMKIWQENLRDDLEKVFISGSKTVSADAAPKYEEETIKAAISWIISPLRETLTLAINEGDQSEAASRVGAKYREWRNAELKSVLFDAMSSAYNNGVVAAASKDSTIKWQVAKQGQCPDCDDNALEPTPAGENFPTGQIAPPAHSGCKCVLSVA